MHHLFRPTHCLSMATHQRSWSCSDHDYPAFELAISGNSIDSSEKKRQCYRSLSRPNRGSNRNHFLTSPLSSPKRQFPAQLKLIQTLILYMEAVNTENGRKIPRTHHTYTLLRSGYLAFPFACLSLFVR